MRKILVVSQAHQTTQSTALWVSQPRSYCNANYKQSPLHVTHHVPGPSSQCVDREGPKIHIHSTGKRAHSIHMPLKPQPYSRINSQLKT